MVFSSLPFLFVFLPAFFLMYGIAPTRWKNALLFLGSMAFYAYGALETPAYIALLLVTIAVNWLIGRCMAPGKRCRKLWLVLGLVYDFFWLLLFKYAGFFFDNGAALWKFATGETITVHNARTKAIPPRYDAVMIGLNTEPRQILYDRIDRRVGVMLEQGLLKEARDLLEDGLLEGTAAQAIGYKELLAHFRGEMTLEAAADLVRQKSRNYAKRQLTWFRRDERVRWIVYNSPDASAAVLQEATEYLRDKLYNGDVNF